MKAIGYSQPGSIDPNDALIDIELPRPVPSGRDLLVEVQAVSVNPVDTKVRRSAAPAEGLYEFPEIRKDAVAFTSQYPYIIV